MKNLILLFLVLLSGCTYVPKHHGVSIQENDLKTLQLNKSSAQDIFKILGTPTFLSIKTPLTTLYYASMELKVAPDRRSTVMNSKVYAFSINDKGILLNIADHSGFRNIVRCSEATPEVRKPARFIEEILASSAARFK